MAKQGLPRQHYHFIDICSTMDYSGKWMYKLSYHASRYLNDATINKLKCYKKLIKSARILRILYCRDHF